VGEEVFYSKEEGGEGGTYNGDVFLFVFTAITEFPFYHDPIDNLVFRENFNFGNAVG